MLKRYNKVVMGDLNPYAFKNDYAFKRVSEMELFRSFDLEGSLCSVSVDSTGTYLLGGEDEGRVVLYDLARISNSVNCDGEISLFKAYPNKPCPSPMDVNWFPTNEGMFSTLSCGVLKFYDANADTDDPVDAVDTATNSKFGWHFSVYKHHPWNSAIVIGMSRNEIRMYDLKVGAFVQTLTLPPTADLFTQVSLSRKSPTTLAASAVSRSFPCGSYILEYDGRNWSQALRSYVCDQVPTGKPLKRKQDAKFAHSRSISYLEYSDNGQYLYSHSIDGVLKKWSTDFGNCLHESQVPGKELYSPNQTCMAITETSPTVAVVPRKDGMFLIDLDNNYLLRELKGHVSQIRDVKYDPVFNRIFSVAKEHMLLVWENKGTAVHDREALNGNLSSIKTEVSTKLFDTDSDGGASTGANDSDDDFVP